MHAVIPVPIFYLGVAKGVVQPGQNIDSFLCIFVVFILKKLLLALFDSDL